MSCCSRFAGPEDIAGRWLCGDWSPDGNQIAVNSDDPTVVIWDTSTGDEISTFSGHQDRLGITWSPDGTRILSNGTNGEAMIWEAANGQLLLNLFPTVLQSNSIARGLDKRRKVGCNSQRGWDCDHL